MRTKIDLERLAIEIRDMSRDSLLYKTLKSELSKSGHWKNKDRGVHDINFLRRHKE